MQMFESNNKTKKKHDFDHNIKLWEATGTLMYQFFWKSINLKVPNQYDCHIWSIKWIWLPSRIGCLEKATYTASLFRLILQSLTLTLLLVWEVGI